jgi:hypothetical protein
VVRIFICTEDEANSVFQNGNALPDDRVQITEENNLKKKVKLQWLYRNLLNVST